jgi:sec-independent protein translocase protein TatC
MSLATLPAPPATDPDDRDELDDASSKMSFLEHLDELRRRLIAAALAIAAGFGICMLFIEYIFGFIMRPLTQVLPAGGKLVYTEPAEAFMLYMKVAALAGLVLASPVVLLQVWLFIAPGLYAHEKKFAVPFVAMTTFFFVAGALFSHFIAFPWTWKFFASFSTDYMEFMPKIGPVFSLYAKMLLGFGLIFQMPTVVFFLARFGIISAKWLLRYFKYAVLIIFVIAAVISPGTDIVSQLMMAIPMLALYAISIIVAALVRPRKGVHA